MSFKDFVSGFAQTSKTYIEKLEQYKELTGEQKKERLDDILKGYCECAIDKIGLNFILKFAFKKIVIENIPVLTQIVFDLIKEKIDGITK